MTTPGGIVEWAASDGRRGSLKGPGKAHSCGDKSTEQAMNKGMNKGTNSKNDDTVDEVSENPHSFTEDEDKKLLDWKNENGAAPWKDCANLLGRTHFQCKDRYKELQGKNGAQDAGNAKGSGGGSNKKQQQGKENNKRAKSGGDDGGANPHGFTDAEDKRMMDWRSEHSKQPWTDFAEEIGKTSKQCHERFREIKPNDWKPTEGQDGGDGGGKEGNNQGNKDGNKNGNKKGKKQGETTAGTDAGCNNSFWGGSNLFGGDDSEKDKAEAAGNDNRSGDAGSSNSKETNNASGIAAASGNNEPSWGSGGWNNNQSGGTGDTSCNNGNDTWDNNAGANNNGRKAGDWGATTGGNNSGGNTHSWGDDPWGSGNGAGDNTATDKNGGGDKSWDKATAGGDANNATATDWNDDSNKQTNNGTSGGDQNAWDAGDTWVAAPALTKTASKAGSKAHSNHSASHKSSHRHSAQNNPPTPVELEVKPDDVFSANDLRLVARILQQDYQMVWNRVSWRFKDKTGRTIAPEVFEKKITGQVEGKEGKEQRKERKRK